MVEYQADVRRILGDQMYRKLKGAVKGGKITLRKAQQFAFELDTNVGGSFKNSRGRQDFEYDGDVFMQILGEYFGKSEPAEQERLPDKIIEILRHEDLGLNSVASELEEVKPQTRRKRKGEEMGLEQSLPKKRRGEITSTHFYFKEGTTAPAPGTKPRSSYQGREPICTYHAMAKCIQQKLHDHQIDADHDKIVDSLLKLFGDDRKSQRNPKELDTKTIRVNGTEQKTGRCLVVTVPLGVNSWNAPWPIILPERKNNLRTSSVDILAIGLLQLTQGDPDSNHAVYIESYNTRTHEVQTINSWGNQGELGIRDQAGQLTLRGNGIFYAVCFVELPFFQETDLFYLDTKLLITSPSQSNSLANYIKKSELKSTNHGISKLSTIWYI